MYEYVSIVWQQLRCRQHRSLSHTGLARSTVMDSTPPSQVPHNFTAVTLAGVMVQPLHTINLQVPCIYEYLRVFYFSHQRPDTFYFRGQILERCTSMYQDYGSRPLGILMAE